MNRPSHSGAALVITLSLLILLSVCILAFMAVVRSDRQSASLTAATTRAEILGRSAGHLVLSDLVSEMRDGSTNLGSTNFTSYLATTNLNMLPQRLLAAAAMGANTNFANLYKQSVPGAFYAGTGFASNGPSRASDVGTWEASHNGRTLSAVRWNKPNLLFGPGFSSTNELPRWIYFNRRETCDATLLNPATWSAALADSRATNQDYVVGRVAYNIYEIGGCLDANVAGGLTGIAKQQLMSSLAGAVLTNLPGVNNAASLVSWRNAATGTNTSAYLAYAATNGLKAGFLEKTNGDRRFISRQDLIAYCRENTGGGVGTNALPYLTHFSRGLDRPSWPATTAAAPATYNGTARPTDLNPAPLTVRYEGNVALPDGVTHLKAGDPVAFRRFSLRRLGLLSSTATATKDDANPIYRTFGLYRAAATDPWSYDHGANNRILRLDEVKARQCEPDFFEMLQAAIITGSLGTSIGSDNFALLRQNLDQNIYRHILQIGANLIDQYDADDYPSELQLQDANGTVMSIFGVENLPYINEIPVFYYRPAALPRTLAQGWMQFEVWNPHQNAVSPSPATLRIAATRGTVQLRIKNSGTLSPADYDPSFVAATDNVDAPPVDFSSTPAYIEFQNGSALQEPKLLGPGDVGSYPITSGSSVVETTPMTMDLSGTRVVDSPSEIKFAGIKVGEKVVPDDRVDGKPDKKAYTDTALVVYNSFTFLIGSGTNDPLTIEAQIKTPDGWKTYQRLEGFRKVQSNLTSSYSGTAVAWVSGIRPRNKPDPNVWSGWTKLGAAFDPRTSRFNLFDSDAPSPGNSLRPDTTQEGDHSNAKVIDGTGWHVGAKSAFGTLAVNISSNPVVTADNLYYADPDGVMRRADGEERSTVSVANRVFPLGSGHLSDRPRILNRPFESVGDMGYAFRDVPWKTLDFWTKDSGDAALLDFFTTDETALDATRRPLHAGVINPNTVSPPVLTAILDASVQAERSSSEGAQTTLSGSSVQTLAQALSTALKASPIASRAGLAQLADDDTSGPGAAIGAWRKTEKETFVRAMAPVAEPGVWNVCIDLVAQAGRFPPTASGLRDFVVQGEAHYWIFAAIDRATGAVIDTQYELVNE